MALATGEVAAALWRMLFQLARMDPALSTRDYKINTLVHRRKVSYYWHLQI